MALADEDLPPGIDLTAPQGSQTAGASVLPRCWPEVDTQETAGSYRGNAWICLAWAHGRCMQGVRCTALHRLPSLAEEQRLTYSADGVEYDVFGRPRAAASLLSPVPRPIETSTLFVSGLDTRLSQRELRLALERFAEWGCLTRTWCGVEPGTGYVRFRWRASAEFAVEAVHGRSLDPEGGPPLHVSFATTCPETEQSQNARTLALRALEEAKRRRDKQHDLYARLENESRTAKMAKASASPGLNRMGNIPRIEHPDTSAAVWQIEPGQRVNEVTEVYSSTDKEVAQSTTCISSSVTDKDVDTGVNPLVDELPTGWVSGVDPASGFVYFYHVPTGKSQWERPGSS